MLFVTSNLKMMQLCHFSGRRQEQGRRRRDLRQPGQVGHERQSEQRQHRLHRRREQNRVRRDSALQEMIKIKRKAFQTLQTPKV